MMDYATFLQSKSKRFVGEGFQCDPSRLPSAMFEWQRKIVGWATKKGRCAIWADTGLGKTLMQLAWADQVMAYTEKPVLILAPLAVSAQTVREAHKFGLQARVCSSTEDAVATTLGRRLVEGLARGEIIDRSQVQPQSGTKKRIATPAGLARFFKPNA